jgi:hypothetical protein
VRFGSTIIDPPVAGFSVVIHAFDLIQQRKDKLDVNWFDSGLAEGHDNLLAAQGEHGVAGTLLALHKTQAQEQRFDLVEAYATRITAHTFDQLVAFCHRIPPQQLYSEVSLIPNVVS